MAEKDTPMGEYYDSAQYEVIRNIKTTEEPAAVNTPFIIRQSLPHATTFGIMGDKLNTHILSVEPTLETIRGKDFLQWGCDQAGKNSLKKVPVMLSLQYEGTENNLSKNITSFDMAVYNAIATRFYYYTLNNSKEPFIITPQEIWRTLNDDMTNRTPSKAQVEIVEESLDKMRFTRFYMDFSKELKANYIKDINDDRISGGCIETYLLQADKVKFMTEKGRTITGYRINAEPILYTYNKAKNHIIYFESRLLDTSANTNADKFTIEVKLYLLHQIELMKKGIRNNTRILFSTLYKDAGIIPPEDRIDKNDYSNENSYKTALRKLTLKDRKKIFSLLDAWKDMHAIKDYDSVHKGQSIVGVDIILIDENLG